MFQSLLIPLGAGLMRQAISSGIRSKLGAAVNFYQNINEKIGPFGYGFLYAGGTVQGYHLNSSIYNKPFKYIGSPRRISKL
tara:strand:- start:221 stop:463 length:243 start_codon:yes stop_codon:yes gene_type:complete